MKLTLDHDLTDEVLDWLKALITINSGFIGVVLISSSNDVVKPITWVAVVFAISLLMSLLAMLGLIMHKKQEHSEILSKKASLSFILGWLLFLIGIGIVCWRLLDV